LTRHPADEAGRRAREVAAVGVLLRNRQLLKVNVAKRDRYDEKPRAQRLAGRNILTRTDNQASWRAGAPLRRV